MYVCIGMYAHMYIVIYVYIHACIHIGTHIYVSLKPLGNVSERLVINKAFSEIYIWIMSSVPFLNQIRLGKEIKNNAWVTVNNDFLSRVRRFGNDFHDWRSHEWKSLPNHLTSDKKIVIHGNECIILFLTRYFMSWTHKSAENYHRALISPLLPRAAFSDRALWRHHNWSVTSCEHEILVLWRHICLLSLHAQIGAKAIFTSEQPWILISRHPVFTA